MMTAFLVGSRKNNENPNEEGLEDDCAKDEAYSPFVLYPSPVSLLETTLSRVVSFISDKIRIRGDKR
jgi:hypothetical protein